MPLAPRIFFSYASEDAYWVDRFRLHFQNIVSTAVIRDYRAESVVQFGELASALAEQIRSSAVVVAFVSDDYKRKEWTVAEWERGLREHGMADDRGKRLVFVPIMLDGDAKAWWQQLRRDDRLHGLSRDYQYAEFTEGGRPADLDKQRVIEKVIELAKQVRRDIDDTEPDNPERMEDTKPPPVPENPRPEPGQPSFVILGHPSANFPPELKEETLKLSTALGTQYVSWGDGWRGKGTARAEVVAETDPVFVQPIADTEVDDYVDDKNRTNSYLMKLGRPKARVAIWLPARYSEPNFNQAVQKAAQADPENGIKYPALRADVPEDLAKWLRAQVFGSSPDEMVIQIQGYGSQKDVNPQTALETQTLVTGLHNKLWDIVSHLVAMPKPASPVWPFWDTQFGEQIQILPSSRAIVAVHDLDIPRTLDRTAIKKRVEKKFDMMFEQLKAAQEQRGDKMPPLRLFWLALLVNHARALPFGRYPDDGRYKDWSLLGFSSNGQGNATDSPPEPDQASLAVFRTNLLAWAAAT